MDCKCVKVHSPVNPTVEVHHYPPQSYPLAANGKRLTITLCSNAHGIQHRLLNIQRTAGAHYYPRGYSQFHRDLAAYTWANTDMTKPIPRTVASTHTLPNQDLLP